MPDDSYPAQIGKKLRADPDSSGYKIEILNTGLRWGTTAEILTHYLLKYRYYDPDIVIVNPGGNDPGAYSNGAYQPDFSNWRKSISAYPYLKPHIRWLLHSKAVSAFVILAFYPDIPEGETFVHHGQYMPAQWFTFSSADQSSAPWLAPVDEIAFYRNCSSFVREMKADGAEVFLLSYQGNPAAAADQAAWRKFYDWEESLLARVAEEQSVGFAPFPLEHIPAGHWIDPSHQDATGYGIKADYVLEKIRPTLLGLRR